MLEYLIPGAVSLLSSFIGGTKEPPKFGVSAADINKLIDKYRESGQAGLAQLGIQERENATARLAASGIEPTLGMQQALFNPVLQKLSIGRSELEGKLASAEGSLLMGQAQGQQTADLAGYQNFTDLFGGLGDLAGLFALQGYFNPSSNFKPQNQWSEGLDPTNTFTNTAFSL